MGLETVASEANFLVEATVLEMVRPWFFSFFVTPRDLSNLLRRGTARIHDVPLSKDEGQRDIG